MLFLERQVQEMGRIVALGAMFLTACAAPVGVDVGRRRKRHPHRGL